MMIQLNTTNVLGIILLMLTITMCIIILMGAWNYAFGAGKNMIEYIGTSDWLTEVDKCVDLYQETEQNETLYYGCMNNLERDNVHYQ